MAKAKKYFELLGGADLRASVLAPDRVAPHAPLRAFRLLLDCYARHGMMAAAAALLAQLRQCGFEPDVPIYDSLIHGYISHGQPDLAKQLYEEMLERGIPPQLSTLSTLMHGYRHNLPMVLHTFREMERLGLTPDAVCYNVVLDALLRQGSQDPEATRLLQTMRARGCSPDVRTFAILMSAAVRSKNKQKVLDTLQQARASQLTDRQMLNAAVNFFAHVCGDAATADVLFAELQAHAARQNSAVDVHVYQDMLVMHGKGKRLDRVAQLWQQCQAEHPTSVIPLGAFHSVMAAWCAAGNIVEALRVFEQLRSTRADELEEASFFYLIKAHSQAGNAQRAEDLLNEMLQWHKVPLSGRCVVVIGRALHKQQDLVGLERLEQLCTQTQLPIPVALTLFILDVLLQVLCV